MPVPIKTRRRDISAEDEESDYIAPSEHAPRLLTALSIILLLIALAHFIAITHQAEPSTAMMSCLTLIRNSDYTTFVGLQPSKQQMAAVQFVDQLVGGTPAALVPVVNSNAQQSLDVYIYGCSMQQETPTLTLLFKRQGLIQGTISVSDANTLVIGEHDTTIAQTNSVLLQPLQQNVYQEYTWENGSFVQVPFPGLYPVTNRSGAATLQTEANNGQSLPWTDPLLTAEQMTKDVLGWSTSNPGDRLLDNSDGTAHVLLIHKQPELRITVTLKQLVQRNGLWFVTAASTSGITLDQSRWRIPMTSPVSMQGTITNHGGPTSIQLFDHTYSPVPPLNAPTLTIAPGGIYNTSIAYGAIPNQQGLLLIEDLPSTGQGQLLLTGVILS